MKAGVDTASEFLRRWDCGVNFVMDGECIPFAFEFPALDRIVEALLADDKTIAITGTKPDSLEVDNVVEQFRGRSLENLLQTSFQLTHFELGRFDQRGSILQGFGEQVMEPWRQFLRDNGFSWDRCYALMRISGPGTVTGYHVDGSNVLFWNVTGHKRFHGLRDPDAKAPLEQVLHPDHNKRGRPQGITAQDVHTLEVGDGAFIWNHLMTPHWVEAPALSFGINLSHGGLRHEGRLGPREQAYYEARGYDKHPEKIWRKL